MSLARPLSHSTTKNLASSQQPTVILTSSHRRPSVSSASETEPRRSLRTRRPSNHKLESDEYQASSRASTPAPGLFKPNAKPKSKKRGRGKRGHRPGRIVQPYADTWPTSHQGSPGSPSSAGSDVNDSHLASPGPSHKAPKTVDRAEAVRRASAYLGTDASRYSNATLQEVVAQIEDPGEEVGSGPMEIEAGGAPALRQSAGRVGLESRHQSSAGGITDAGAAQGAEKQSAAAHNSPAPEQTHLVPPADNSDTEPGSESETVELGPNDSVSQRVPPIPRTSHSSHPRPTLIPRAPDHAHKAKAKPAYDADANSDTNTVDESDTSSDSEPEEEAVRSLKRQRTAPTSQPHTLPARQPHRSAPSRPRVSSALPAAPGSSELRATTSNTSSSHNLQEPPPLSDVSAVLAWASRFAKQTSTSRQVTQAGDYQLLATVLDDLRRSHLVTSKQERVPPRPQRVGLAEDNAVVLEAEAALALGTHARRSHKPTLADFPGFPRHIATLAIPDLVATAITKGAYEPHKTLSAMATKCYDDRWARELPDLRLQKAPPPLTGLMAHRVSWARCESKVRVRPIVPPEYHIRNPPRTRDDVRYNKKLVKKLLPNAFHCRNLLTDIDPYAHKALAHCVAATFFWATDAIGMIHHDKFYPMPLPAIAMVLTTMQHCLSEWKSGRYVPRELNVDTQRKMYDAHLTGLQNFGKVKADELKQLRIDLFWYAIDYAGGTLDDDEPYQAITWADRVPPDAADPDDDAGRGSHSSARSSVVAETRRHRHTSGVGKGLPAH